MSQPFIYCSRCGARPGEKSTCVGIYSEHNFISGSGNVYCSRCGAVPGAKSTCVGIYSEHNFISGSGNVYCSRCGAVIGKKSTCVGIYSEHNFVDSKLKFTSPHTVALSKDSAKSGGRENPPSQKTSMTDDKNFKQTKTEDHFKERDITKISILFLAADPSDASRLRLGEEYREIQEKLRQSKLRDLFQLELPQLSARPADISQAMLDTNPQIVHFSGHGTTTGALCFENQIGQTQDVQPEAIAALFEHFSHQVNCVLLNACYSEKQAKSIAKHIPYVIGMNKAIGDKAAIAFSVGFYQALGADQPIEYAYKLGCVQIRLQGISEHETPVLIRK